MDEVLDEILCFSHLCYLHYYDKHEKDIALPLFLRLLNYLIGYFYVFVTCKYTQEKTYVCGSIDADRHV